MAAIWGRTQELAEFDELIAGARGGAGSIVFLNGPPGIGKSRLLEAAAERASAEGMTVATGSADELDQITPWSSLVRALLSTEPPILDHERLRPSPERIDHRGVALDAFRESLERAATGTLLMVAIDDLQWSDQATVAALGWLPEQLFSYPIVWLLARRLLPQSSLIDALIARLGALGARHWQLEPLPESAALGLAAEIAGRPVDRRARDLVVTTGGNPLFVVEIMRDHGPSGFGPRPEGADDPHIDEGSLQALVAGHVRSLSSTTVEFLKVASVLGTEFAVSEASELSGQSSARLLPVIEEAIAGGVLVDKADQLAFRHDVFRQVLYSTVPGPVRRSLHRDAATVLRRNGASPTRLANQLMIGAEAGDREALSSLGEAVGELVGTSPWAAADLAVRMVDLTAPETPQRETVVSTAVQLLGWAVRTEEARALGEGFLDTTEVSPVTEAEILLGIRRAWICRYTRPYPRPVPPWAFDDPSVPAPVRAALIAFEQLDPMCRNDLARADAALEDAVALLAGAGGDLDAASIRPLWVLAAQLRGEFEVALERAGRNMQVVGSTNEAAGMAVSENSVAQCLGGLGRPRQGLATVDRAMRAAEASGYGFIANHCRCLRAAFFLDTGRLDDARAEATAAIAVSFDSGFLPHATLALTTLIEASVRKGDLATADAALRRLSQDGEGESINLDEFWATAILAVAHGRGTQAVRTLEPVFASLGQGNFAIASRHPARLPQLVGLAMGQGDEDRAQLVVWAARHLANGNERVSFLERIARHARGLHERDGVLLRSAYELSDSSDVPLWRAILIEDVGSIEAEHGQRSGSVTALEEAFASFTEMGAHLDAARVRAKLRKLGVRKRYAATARPDRGWVSLTSAELSVARAVGNGLTNRATADQLCISPDTVNTHLRHAFAKLDIRSRVELARLVAINDVEN